MSATNDQLQEQIDSLEKRVAELERLLKTASKGKARTSSVIADCEAAAKTPVPILLQHNKFLDTWKEFCRHRCELATKGNINRKKFPWTERAAKALLKKCEAWGAAKAIEAMNISMDKGWADIFPPADSDDGNRNGKTQFFA
jgi:hypothetical protein